MGRERGAFSPPSDFGTKRPDKVQARRQPRVDIRSSVYEKILTVSTASAESAVYHKANNAFHNLDGRSMNSPVTALLPFSAPVPDSVRIGDEMSDLETLEQGLACPRQRAILANRGSGILRALGACIDLRVQAVQIQFLEKRTTQKRKKVLDL